MTILRKIFAAVAVVGMFASGAALAQNATVHGHVIDPVGMPVAKGEVKFTKDVNSDPATSKFLTTVELDANGNYVAKDVVPGNYLAYVFQDGKTVDRLPLAVTAGADLTLDFDMTREAYMKDLSPERKKEIEEYRKKYASVSASNKVILNLNATLKTVRADLAAAQPTKGDVSKDVTDMKGAVDSKPEEGVLWIVYADTLQAEGDHLAAADKVAGKPSLSDEDVLKNYNDAAAAYQKGIDLTAASKKPAPADQAIAYNSLGNVEGKLGKVSDSSAAFENAVKLDPTKGGMYYNNEAAILFNNQQNDGALAAAEKAIAADPNRPDPYFIKGQILIAKATLDPKTQKLVAPPGCIDAYQHFLSLAPPNDPKVAQVKEVLAAFGEKVDTKYRAGKK
jgi:tetratricopeptide (TPR) repeat protein